jgi:uncharacterized protein (TIGR02271 family)
MRSENLDSANDQDVAAIVVDKNGLLGRVVEDESSSSALDHHLLLQFQSGERVLVPSEMLIRHADGRYHLQASVQELVAGEGSSRRKDALEETGAIATEGLADARELIIPVTEDAVTIQTRQRQSGVVEIHKTVHERAEVVDQPLHSEEVEVERVAINRFVEAPLPVRQEGDTTIIPLLEEVLVVEKRLLLREEVHVKKLNKEVHEPQEVLLREERVEIVRKAASGQGEDEWQSKTKQ